MGKIVKRWHIKFPATLKYRLIFAFVTLLLLPLCLAVYLLFYNFESIRQNDMIDRMSERMQQVNTSLTDMMAFAYKTHTMLSQDEGVIQIMDMPERYDPLERKRMIESKMAGINNSFFFHQTELYFKLIDHEGNVYSSYFPNGQLTQSRDEFLRWKNELEHSPHPYKWIEEDSNDVYNNNGSKLLSLYVLLQDQRRGTYGLARISIDAQEWFNNSLKSMGSNQEMMVFTGQGERVLQNAGAHFGQDTMSKILAENKETGYYRDSKAMSLVNFSYLNELNWYVVNQVPLEELWLDINRLRSQFFIFLLVLLVLFVSVTIFVAARMTRPLYVLQRSMEEALERKLNVRIPIRSGETQEIVSLGASFNTMIDDIQILIQKLKEEERQKQAVRFQMLLSQMNPHFLLNTLNTVKWMARKEKQEAIAELCTALGGLLEASLNSELELLPLCEEIRLLQAYESIQKMRYRDRFTMIYEIDPAISYALVPKLSMQPLVENAIMHGFDREEMGGTIHIRAGAENGKLILEIEDDGVGFEESARKPKRRGRQGIGISNVRERLQLLYKKEGYLELVSPPTGALVRITIPLLIATPYTQGEISDVDDLSGRR